MCLVAKKIVHTCQVSTPGNHIETGSNNALKWNTCASVCVSSLQSAALLSVAKVSLFSTGTQSTVSFHSM